MYKPLALFVGLRYTRAKRNNYFISFMALTSMLGIALGVAVLITVLSVMNGFDEEIKADIRQTLDFQLTDNQKARIIDHDETTNDYKTSGESKIRSQKATHEFYAKKMKNS